MLDDFGLQAALQWPVRDVISRYGLMVELRMEGDFDDLPERYRTCVYRAVQEALTNCVRHAKARSVVVSVTSDGEQLDVTVTDDGIGFDPARRHAGLGLRGIEERVKELQGAMTIDKVETGGTKLAIRLPWRTPSAQVPLAHAVG
jgi:signal transduction histidine kinase